MVAIIIALTCWVITATAPEVDLEDEHEELSRPLFSRAGEEESLDAMDWEAEEEETPGRRKRRG